MIGRIHQPRRSLFLAAIKNRGWINKYNYILTNRIEVIDLEIRFYTGRPEKRYSGNYQVVRKESSKDDDRIYLLLLLLVKVPEIKRSNNLLR